MRKPIIVGNWKMYKNITEAVELANGIKRKLYDIDYAEIGICPPFTALSCVAEVVAESNIQLGAQNLFWEKEGAFTGEVAASLLKDAGCKLVIIGHSERRQFFGETNEDVHKKLRSALDNHLTPIVCVGERLEEREKGITFKIIKEQLEGGLKGIELADIEKISIAYEPVWAIGTGKVATPEIAQEAHKYIRDWLTEIYGIETAEKIRIQYGGSVKPDNIAGLMSQADIDGALVGGASLKVESFCEIVLNSKLSLVKE